MGFRWPAALVPLYLFQQLAGAAALAGCAVLPAMPAAAAEIVGTFRQIDRAAVAGRFHAWAFICPQLGDRIDAMLSRLDYILSTGEGTGEFLETVELCRTRVGRDVSIDWLVGGEGADPNGQPHRMFHDEAADDGMSADDAKATLLRDFRERTAEQQSGLL